MNTRRNRKQPVVQFSLDGVQLGIFNTATDAAESIGVFDHNGCGHILECCKGQRLSAYGFNWKYYIDPVAK